MILERIADFAKLKMIKCLIHCIHCEDADSDSRANESEQSLRLSSETDTSDHQ
jgi:hypothetical protein